MPIRHTVRKGDSLWSLANRYLGSGTRYPKIIECHNNEIARFKLGNKLIPIKNENLIYVDQIILIPPKEKNPPEGTGTKAMGGKIAVPVNLKIEYAIGQDTPPIVYGQVFGDYSVKIEMTGKIAVEMSSMDRYRHSLELLMSKNQLEAKQKLHDTYDPAIRALTAKPEMVMESAQVKIKAPIASEANLGPYTIEIQFETPNHLSGSLKPPVICGNVEADGGKYKYEAEIELKADVILHPKPRGKVDDPANVKLPIQEPAAYPVSNKIDWQKVASETGKVFVFVIVTIGTAAAAIAGGMLGVGACLEKKPSETMMAFSHTIDLAKKKEVTS